MRIENENFHAGDVLKHPIDVIARGRNQHHFFRSKICEELFAVVVEFQEVSVGRELTETDTDSESKIC